MPRHETLALENLKLLDAGKINVAFAAAVKQVVADCTDRASESKPRTIDIKFAFRPDPNEPQDVQVQVQVVTKTPARRSKVYNMLPKLDANLEPELVFHPDLPDDPENSTLFENED